MNRENIKFYKQPTLMAVVSVTNWDSDGFQEKSINQATVRSFDPKEKIFHSHVKGTISMYMYMQNT